MAFLPVISVVPASFEVECDDDVTYLVSIAIARCGDTDRVVSVESRLSYTQNPHSSPSALWFHEFSFSILVVSVGDDTPTFETQDREMAKAYLPGCSHSLVLPIVEESLKALVVAVKPPTIYYMTKTMMLPPKALKKYEKLTDVLLNVGYKIHDEGTDAWRRKFWLLHR